MPSSGNAINGKWANWKGLPRTPDTEVKECVFAKIDKGDGQNWLITTATSVAASVVRKQTETRTVPCSNFFKT